MFEGLCKVIEEVLEKVLVGTILGRDSDVSIVLTVLLRLPTPFMHQNRIKSKTKEIRQSLHVVNH